MYNCCNSPHGVSSGALSGMMGSVEHTTPDKICSSPHHGGFGNDIKDESMIDLM